LKEAKEWLNNNNLDITKLVDEAAIEGLEDEHLRKLNVYIKNTK
jgi:hypothetical protein